MRGSVSQVSVRVYRIRTAGGTRILLRDVLVDLRKIAELTPEHVAVDRCEHLVEEALRNGVREIGQCQRRERVPRDRALMARRGVGGVVDGVVEPAVLLVPLVGWSRVALGRHTVRQVVLGAVAAVAVTTAVLRAYGFP